MESHHYDGKIDRKILDLIASPHSAADVMAAALEDPTVREIRTRKIGVGEEVELGGRRLRLTEGGWRRVDRYDAAVTHELTPMERRLVSD